MRAGIEDEDEDEDKYKDKEEDEDLRGDCSGGWGAEGF
jgi:hypothetical protein